MSCVASPVRPALRRGRAAGDRRRRHRLRRRARRAPAVAPSRLRARRRHRALRAGQAAAGRLPALPRAADDRAARSASGCERIDAAVVAYPHAAAAPTVGALRELGARVVDLSADFRLRSLPTYERWYGEHPRPELLEQAVYGLSELHREQIATAAIVANPGCYPTASVLALAPLARAGLIADVVIDAKQGISGAGRVFDESTHLSIAGENIVPYKVAAHRHTPGDRGAADRAGPGAPRAEGPVPGAPRAARPGRDGQLLRHDHAAGRSRGAARPVRRRLRRGAVRRARRLPRRACWRCARPTSAGCSRPPTSTPAR